MIVAELKVKDEAAIKSTVKENFELDNLTAEEIKTIQDRDGIGLGNCPYIKGWKNIWCKTDIR